MSPVDSPVPEMSSATKEILARARQLVPPMLSSFHKGQLGRIGVIGGSENYTGAPYFSAMASARLGCDMSHVICTPAAGAVIKTYSPNLMVHPLMREGREPGSEGAETDPKAISKRVIDELLPRLHVLVVGPGLGRDPLMQQTVGHVVAAARKANLPLVLDADALQLVQKQPELVRGYPLAVLTPNVVEFGRLEKALLGDDKDKDGKDDKNAGGKALRLSKALGGVTIVEKGAVDTVAAYTDDSAYGPYKSDLTGGRKRSGGQGDTLTGAIGTLLGWRKAYHDGLWDTTKSGKPLDERETVLLAAFAGSAITRECSRLAFVKRGRSLQASDLTDEVHTAFTNLFGADEDEDASGEGASKL
ncbi:hypothetical protein SPBR_05985 [Sporothrix brasiliensis 5110]|uniref:ATP-dependent (S)-NAD(P)H-hydrate dehydratase n=1 Tax=Sporothrix brasiliensis 5110 TaxID=1398154 RepID=A0A0C2J4P4_9PEZI|nr:uncharacterized protein SPBR_05985 [Sporothrix brasiliensis 5110]KIH94000.1 hypothetical protein SPBR_05985 [Sporothrix brasiliensis 5110]